MPRSIIVLIVIVVVLIGGLFVLANRKSGKQPVHVEKVVPLENLAR